MAALRTKPEPAVGARERLFDARARSRLLGVRPFDVGPDDRRLLMLYEPAAAEAEPGDLIYIRNWYAEVDATLGGT